MLDGTFALLERSLRIDVRSRSSHLIRFGLMGAIYICLCQALTTQSIFGAPGLRFFSSIVYLDLACLTLTGIGFFATTITEEKEEDTLGLMMMAGISPLGILMGKSLCGLWQTILLIAVQFPFILLSVTMGGVTQQQVWSATVAMTAYVVLLAGMGLLCSTMATQSRAAVRWMCLFIVVYVVIPLVARQYLQERIRQSISSGLPNSGEDLWSTVLKYTDEFSIFTQIGRILTTSFEESALSFQVVANFLTGLICAGLSWLAFGRATRNPSSEAMTRDLVTRRNRFSPFSTDRTWDNGFMWKDFHFVGGGLGMMLLRIASFCGVGLVPLVAETIDERTTGEWLFFSIMFMVFGSSLTAANILARSMHDEIKGQTLSALMMLPTTPANVVYSKYAGAMLGWVPAIVCGPLTLFTSKDFRHGLEELLRNFGRNFNGENFAIVTLAILLYAMFFILIPHLAAYLATHVGWGAVPLAFGLSMGVYFVGGTCISLMTFATAFRGNQSTVLVILFFCDAALILLCVACHVGVLLRVQQLAAK